jgi:hypothetical protein
VGIVTSTNNYDRYMQLILRLGDKSNGASRAKVGAVLASTMCEQLASHLISSRNGNFEDIQFDPYYREKHEVAKRKLVDRLKTELSNAGKELQFFVCAEEANELGRFDLTIVNGSRLKIQAKSGKKLVVEVKASLGLDLAQIERYLFNGEPLLIIRIMTGQVKLLRPRELSSFLEESMSDLVSKAERILASRPLLVPGYECYRCPLSDCDYNKSRARERHIVSMNQKEFDEDVKTFMLNLYPTIKKAIQIILKELEVEAANPSCGEAELSASSQLEQPQSQPHHSHGKDTENHERQPRGS